MARSKKTRKPRRRQRTKAIEWVGTQLSLPAMIDDDDTEPYHPGLVLWLSLPEGLIVGQEMFHPDEIDVALRHSLAVALEEAPRSARPSRVRLSDPRLVEAAREVLGPEAQIVVAPVPEVEELVEGLVASMDREEPSYFEDDSIPVDCVRDLFAAAAYLYRARPWEGAGDQQVVRFDSPELGVDGVCVSILGQAGEALGIALFPSLDAFDGFCDAAAEDDDDILAAPLEMGSESIVLLFEEGDHLPARLLAEVEEHGLEVAGQGAYPLPLHCGPGGERLPLNEHEVRVLAACARGIGSFYLRHGSLFRDEIFEPVSETYEEAGGLEVRMTAPYESFDEFEDEFEDDDEISDDDDFEDGFGNQLDFEVEPPPKLPAPPRAGRNEPCPCGSGKKYKKCHLPLDEAERHAEAQASVLHDLDRSLVARIDAFARQRFGRLDWTSDAFDDPRLSAALATPYHVWGHRIEGRTPAQWFREAHDEHLSRRERGWFDAQEDAWLSLWEVRDVEPGRGLTLFDFLTGTSRPVIEAQGSQTLAPNDVVLARVVRYEGENVLCGLYPRVLGPRDGAAVVEQARKRLRRKGDVPVERLRDDKISVYLIRRFEEAVEEMLQRYAGPRQLANTDGDELLMTSDHFDITPGREADLERGLAALEGASAEQGDEGFSVDFLREADPSSPAPLRQTLIGQALVAGGRLSVETNSIRRADALRSRIEAACGDLLQHRARSHADPLSTSAKAPSSPPPAPPPGAEEAVRALLEEHYATWPDVALPALGGQTPREASRTKEGKRELDLLLKEMENQEARMPAGPGFDFSKLRRELGVE